MNGEVEVQSPASPGIAERKEAASAAGLSRPPGLRATD